MRAFACRHAARCRRCCAARCALTTWCDGGVSHPSRKPLLSGSPSCLAFSRPRRPLLFITPHFATGGRLQLLPAPAVTFCWTLPAFYAAPTTSCLPTPIPLASEGSPSINLQLPQHHLFSRAWLRLRDAAHGTAFHIALRHYTGI